MIRPGFAREDSDTTPVTQYKCTNLQNYTSMLPWFRFVLVLVLYDIPKNAYQLRRSSQVMQENMLLIKEINMQRGHNKAAKRVLEAQVRK